MPHHFYAFLAQFIHVRGLSAASAITRPVDACGGYSRPPHPVVDSRMPHVHPVPLAGTSVQEQALILPLQVLQPEHEVLDRMHSVLAIELDVPPLELQVRCISYVCIRFLRLKIIRCPGLYSEMAIIWITPVLRLRICNVY
ncbi:uncharacterized protein LOC135432932 [Drosophila montana]|uniref:uncharacterized protein LOC135432932 n=1 Tax=Drosophila montana TaxID=40370 RepID=UPI00313B3CA3